MSARQRAGFLPGELTWPFSGSLTDGSKCYKCLTTGQLGVGTDGMTTGLSQASHTLLTNISKLTTPLDTSLYPRSAGSLVTFAGVGGWPFDVLTHWRNSDTYWVLVSRTHDPHAWGLLFCDHSSRAGSRKVGNITRGKSAVLWSIVITFIKSESDPACSISKLTCNMNIYFAEHAPTELNPITYERKKSFHLTLHWAVSVNLYKKS